MTTERQLPAVSFPHTRGGVPIIRYTKDSKSLSFPHTRGGVPMWNTGKIDTFIVFPTHVGVYLFIYLSMRRK